MTTPESRAHVEREWTIGTDEAVQRIMQQTARQPCLARTATPVPTPMQVAAVLHALADHTALVQAVNHLPDSPDGPAHSVGRWLHGLGDYFEYRTRHLI